MGKTNTAGIVKFLKSIPLNSQTILVILLLIASFLVGSLYTKVKLLEKGSTTATGTAQPTSKYKSFEEAMRAIAKDLKLDDKKLIACMNSGEKAAVVNADLSEGSGFGVNGTPGFFINGRFLGGAFPFESFKEIIDKELAGQGSTNYKDYSQSLQDAYTNPRGKLFDPEPKNISVGNASVKGNGDAPVVIVEYSDFQCPYCERAFPTVQQVLSAYPGKVLFAYKHFPIASIHPHAQKTAEASECARDQGKFWEFHDKLFETQEDWSLL